MRQIHVLNGDALVELMQKAGIEGEYVVWREMLAEGTAVGVPGTPAFITHRKAVFQMEYQVSHQEYEQQCVQAWQALFQLEAYDELVLWFEYDLFCQLNLLGVLALLALQPQPLPTVSLVCSGKWEGHTRLRGLGELEIAEAQLLYQQRKVLSHQVILDAAQLWDLHVAGELETLVSQAKKIDADLFPYLIPALEAHLRRFPHPATGVNEIEQSMLEAIAGGITSERKLVGHMLRQENYYGFGDLQYFHYLEALSPLLKNGDALQLNGLGEQVLKAEKSFQDYAKSEYRYGGAAHWAYTWDGQQLSKRSK